MAAQARTPTLDVAAREVRDTFVAEARRAARSAGRPDLVAELDRLAPGEWPSAALFADGLDLDATLAATETSLEKSRAADRRQVRRNSWRPVLKGAASIGAGMAGIVGSVAPRRRR